MSDDWKVYRTRFLVSARRLTQPLTFIDALGREHSGKPGDYIVRSSEGLLRIAPKDIFEDVYVVLEADATCRSTPSDASALRSVVKNYPCVA